MFKHLLVPLDGSLLAECVLPHTLAFARVFNARVTLLHVVPAPHPGAPIDVVHWRMLNAEAEAYLRGVAARLRAHGVSVDVAVGQGDSAYSVLDHVQHHPIDLAIMSSHGESGLTGWNIGSVVQKVLLRSHISSLLVRAYQPIPDEQTDLQYRRLLVPLDGSLRAECVLPFAAEIARFHDAQLLFAHIVSRPEVPRHLPLSPEDEVLVDRLVTRNREAAVKHLEELVAHLSVPAEFRVLERADVTAGLHEVAESEQADLIVMCAHGYSGETRWPYGRVTSNFIVYGTTPLLLVQDLSAADWPLTAAEVAAEAAGGQRYMPGERFPDHVVQ
jgi:nucleotide-binding universal stress UspA family protein